MRKEVWNRGRLKKGIERKRGAKEKEKGETGASQTEHALKFGGERVYSDPWRSSSTIVGIAILVFTVFNFYLLLFYLYHLLI